MKKSVIFLLNARILNILRTWGINSPTNRITVKIPVKKFETCKYRLFFLNPKI